MQAGRYPGFLCDICLCWKGNFFKRKLEFVYKEAGRSVYSESFYKESENWVFKKVTKEKVVLCKKLNSEKFELNDKVKNWIKDKKKVILLENIEKKPYFVGISKDDSKEINRSLI